MWDNPVLLRNVANTMLALCTLTLISGAAYYLMRMPSVFPLHSVRLSVAPDRVETEQVRQVLHRELRGNLLTVDIRQVRQSLEQLPWVRSVNVRREFPDRLWVRMEEHRALARWNRSGLVNLQGEVFDASSEQELPNFSGPDGTSVEMTRYFELFNRQLAGLDLRATDLVLSHRHAWQVRLTNGMLLELGRDEVPQRLARFVSVYPYSLATLTTEETGKNIRRNESAVALAKAGTTYVDLRYRNGFTVRKAISVKG